MCLCIFTGWSSCQGQELSWVTQTCSTKVINKVRFIYLCNHLLYLIPYPQLKKTSKKTKHHLINYCKMCIFLSLEIVEVKMGVLSMENGTSELCSNSGWGCLHYLHTCYFEKNESISSPICGLYCLFSLGRLPV